MMMIMNCNQNFFNQEEKNEIIGLIATGKNSLGKPTSINNEKRGRQLII